MNEALQVLAALVKAQQDGLPVALATVIHTQGSIPRHAGAKMLIYADGQIVGTIGGGVMEAEVVQAGLAALSDGKIRTERYTLNNPAEGDPGICGGSAEILIEPFGTLPTVLVIGGGHVGKALAELAKWTGYRVVLSDDRAEYCNAAYVPNMDRYVLCAPAQITEQVYITPQTYVAAVTRGLPVDIDLIPALLASEAAYIGVIGSRRRWALTVQRLKAERGLTDASLQRIHAPIGLALRAETPQEIALSIMGEITMLRRGGHGGSIRQAETETPE